MNKKRSSKPRSWNTTVRATERSGKRRKRKEATEEEKKAEETNVPNTEMSKTSGGRRKKTKRRCACAKGSALHAFGSSARKNIVSCRGFRRWEKGARNKNECGEKSGEERKNREMHQKRYCIKNAVTQSVLGTLKAQQLGSKKLKRRNEKEKGTMSTETEARSENVLRGEEF
jgi:hypothetical protein